MFNKLFLLLLLHGSVVNANGLISKVKNMVVPVSPKKSSFVSKVLDLIGALMEGPTLKAETLFNRSTPDMNYVMCEKRRATKHYAAVYKITVTQCKKTGKIVTDFTEESLRPGVAVPPLSEEEKQAAVKWIAARLEENKPLHNFNKINIDNELLK